MARPQSSIDHPIIMRAPMLDPTSQAKLLALADFVLRIGAVFGALWAAFEKVVKPFAEWRLRRAKERRSLMAGEIRSILAPELGAVGQLVESVEEIREALQSQTELFATQVATVLKRQSALFADIDAFLQIARANTERLDEVNDLLDAIGFASTDRRINSEQRAAIKKLLSELHDRQTARRRVADAEEALAAAKREQIEVDVRIERVEPPTNADDNTQE